MLIIKRATQFPAVIDMTINYTTLLYRLDSTSQDHEDAGRNRAGCSSIRSPHHVVKQLAADSYSEDNEQKYEVYLLPPYCQNGTVSSFCIRCGPLKLYLYSNFLKGGCAEQYKTARKRRITVTERVLYPAILYRYRHI